MRNKKYNTSTDQQQVVEETGVEYQAAPQPTPQPTQIMVNIEDISMLRDIKRAISMIRGVVSVEKTPKMKALDRAIADVKAGRVKEFKDLDELKAFFDKL